MEFIPLINLVLAAAIGFFVSFMQQKRGLITSYTKEESKALDANLLSSKELTSYHSNISWGNYSVLLVSLFCVLVSILHVNTESIISTNITIFKYATLEMGVAATILIFSDLIHMNGLSPILSYSNKHRISNTSIRSGLLSIGILLAGMQTFSILIDPQIMFSLCAVELISIIYFQWIRALNQ